MCCVDRLRSQSFADPHDTPKPAVRAAGVGGIADLAIHGKQPFVSGKFWDQHEMPSGNYWPALSAEDGVGRQELRKS